MKLSQRNFGLDLLRAISIWLVLFQHGGISIVEGMQGLKIGGVGVEVFFVLSGFLIGQILIRNLQYDNSLKSIKTFWIRRWFRILPLYYLMLFVKFFFFDSSVGGNIFYYIFFLQNNFYGIHFYEVTWSLVIEEWFYITVPLFLFFAFKLSKNNFKTVLIFFALFIIFENVIRFVYVYKYNVPFGGVNGNVLFRLDSLFWGVLLAYIKMNFNFLYAKLTKVLVFVLGVGGFLCYVYYIKYISTNGAGIDVTLFPRTFGFTLFPFIIALMIPFIDSISSFAIHSLWRKFIYYFITYTSLFTYAIYLVHPLIFPYIIKEDLLGVGSTFGFYVAVFFSYIIASLLYNFYEKPFLSIRDRFFIEKRGGK